ncbi:phytanoyl-CoA dioxygenase family protein [Sphingomonas sp. M1-B02]|uniref:phytanoyl-CoA dioxygenase family protein n=1 Tax=Sphingomonas sp. M1-B02 TaxID=3114300 RepID=UPI002240C7F1|nr:phytanoyl-CoA dioxygenase family protein [Sphingomonas sp. S6-11]UZK65151.1 phytanoyl-CoA dioxygenase family protein [Sphingomonas sp. S6-11]
MQKLKASNDTSAFEVPAVLDEKGRLTEPCVRKALTSMDMHGLVVLTNLLSEAQADVGAELIRQTIDDPDRSRCAFASETDNRYLRRDFCSLPSTPLVTRFAAGLCQSLEDILSEYCGRSHPLLEVTTLTSYFGSSHQYVHRDPSGVISLFAAVEDVSEQQGGTVFIPGTHMYDGAERKHDGNAYALMELFRLQCNFRILLYNLRKLWSLRNDDAAPLAPGEFRDRVFSSKWDEHQPNLLRFALGKNSQFSLRMLSPSNLWKLFRHRAALRNLFHLVQTAPRKGTVILYRSDMLHAGPDNRSPHPRRLFSMSLARGMVEPKLWQAGYSPHPTLTASPMSFGDLLDYPLTSRAQHQTAGMLVD